MKAIKRIFALATLLSIALITNGQNISKNCYRGFVDAGYSIGIGDYEFGRFEVNTTHGYQVSPYFFFGAGMGLHFMPEYETAGMDIALDYRENKVDIPVFANVRCNFSKSKITPFIDVRGGTFVTNNGGLYASASAGCRISINEKQAINVSIGYTTEKLEFETFDRFTNSSSMDYTREARICDTESITLKLGFEF